MSRSLLVYIILLMFGHVAVSPAEEPPTTIIRNVLLFDGEQVIHNATVVVKGERIEQVTSSAIASSLPSGEDILVVDGRGHTLLPGFINSYFPTGEEFSKLDDGLRFGITTVMDLYTNEEKLIELRNRIDSASKGVLPDFFTAGHIATVPEGRGAALLPRHDLLTGEDDIDRWIDSRKKAGVDFIKILAEIGSHSEYPHLNKAMMEQFVRRAHESDLLVIALATNQKAADISIETGVDILAFSWRGGATETMLEKMRQNEVYVMSAFGDHFARKKQTGSQAIWSDLRFRQFMHEGTLEELKTIESEPRHAPPHDNSETLLQLYNNGVNLLVAADTFNPINLAGISFHFEMETLADLGMTPKDILTAATAKPAKAYRLHDRGRVMAGKLADLVLVTGDPTSNIRDTRNIVAIWRKGTLVDRRRGL